MTNFKVLIIGSGRRVQKGILPALLCLGENVEIAAIYSRSQKTIYLGGREFHTITDLQQVNFSEVNLILVSITIENAPDALQRLSKFTTRHITLMLDTPVLRPEALGATKYFSNFQQVLVLEDHLGLPQMVAAKRIIDEGKIGRLQSIHFYQSGYKYHALAALKYLTGSAYIQSIRHQRLSDGRAVKKIKLPGGIQAEIWEPRDYSKGRLLIVGSQGRIADFEGNENNFVISYKIEDNTYRGLAINGQDMPMSELDKFYLENVPTDRLEKDLINSLKIRGLMELVTGCNNPESQCRYSPENGLYDMLAIKISEKFGWFIDYGWFKYLIKFCSKL